MTAIVGCRARGLAALACDSAVTTEDTLVESSPKLVRLPIGYFARAGSVRAGVVAARALRDVSRLRTDRDAETVSSLIFHALRAAGWDASSKDDLPSIEFEAIILTDDAHLWYVGSDMLVEKHRRLAAIGSGAAVAMGATDALLRSGATAERAAREGVRSACKLVPSCGLPVRARTVRW